MCFLLTQVKPSRPVTVTNTARVRFKSLVGTIPVRTTAVQPLHYRSLNGGLLKGGPQLADRAETAHHIHKDATDRYAPCLRALLLFARPIVNIGDFIIVLY